MKHAIKIEDFPNLTVTKVDPVSDMLREFGHDLLGVDRVEELECRPRSGFHPWSHNKGGWGNSGYSSVDSIVGSGCYTGSSKVNDRVDEIYCEETKDILETFLENNNLDTGLTWDDLDDDQTADLHAIESEWFCNADGYLDICFEYQGRYLNYKNGVHTISLNVFIDKIDDIEVIISFRDLSSASFQRNIKKARKILEDFIGNVDLW